jgi:hypothetical protein
MTDSYFIVWQDTVDALTNKGMYSVIEKLCKAKNLDLIILQKRGSKPPTNMSERLYEEMTKYANEIDNVLASYLNKNAE